MKLTRMQRAQLKAMGKTIYDLYPELATRVPVLSYGIQGDMISGWNPSWHYNLGIWRDSVWVMRGLKIISDNLSKLDVNVIRADGEESTILDDHWLTHLLHYPNDAMSGSMFWTWYIMDMILGGEVGVELVPNKGLSQFVEMWPRQPTSFDVRPDVARGGRRYQAVELFHIRDGFGEPYDLPPDNFIHFKFYNPQQPYRGISPLIAYRRGGKIDVEAQDWSMRFFANQARPDMVIVSEQGMSETEKKAFANQIHGELSGQNAHGILVLEKEVHDIKDISFPAKDTEWLAQREFSRDEAGGALGIPDEILGFGKDTYENYETADRILWTNVLEPLTRFRDNFLTHHFSRVNPLLKPNEKIQTNLSGIKQLQASRSEVIEQGKGLFGMGVPYNQIEDNLQIGTGHIPGGDVGWLPFSLVPTGLTVSDRADLGEATALGFDTEGRKRVESPLLCKVVPELDSAGHARIWEAKQRRILSPIQSMKRKLKVYFQAQQIRIGRRLRGDESLSLDKLEPGDPTPPEDAGIPDLVSLFNHSEEVKEFEKRVGPVVFDAFDQIAQTEWDLLDVQDVDTVLQIDAPEAVARVEGILNTYAIKVNDTTYNGLAKIFEIATAEGEGIPEIMDRISVFFSGRKSEYQTERIARTTMTGIDNAASVTAWGQSNVVDSSFWVSALAPNRTRQAHADAHGQEQGLGQMFDVGGEPLEYPGDPNGSPENIINCLCALIAKVDMQ